MIALNITSKFFILASKQGSLNVSYSSKSASSNNISNSARSMALLSSESSFWNKYNTKSGGQERSIILMRVLKSGKERVLVEGRESEEKSLSIDIFRESIVF